MRQSIAIGLLLIFLAGIAAAYDLPLKKIYAQPNEKSNLVYEIPIEVKLLDVSSDANWYKVKIGFDLGVLGKYVYEGWTKIPVGEILSARETKKLALKK